MSIGQQNTSAHHLTIRYYEPTYFCAPVQGKFYFPKRPYRRMCKINSSQLTPESNRGQSEYHKQHLFVLFRFQGSPNEWQLLANGRGVGFIIAFR